MAYGTVTTPGPGTALAFDIIGGAYFGRYKVSFGAEGAATDVSADSPLPVNMAGAATSAAQATIIGLINGIGTALATMIGHVDGLEAALAAVSTRLDAANVSLDAIEAANLSPLSQSSRAYASPGVRQAVGAASSAAVALPTLGATREVRIVATARCYLRFGNSGVAEAAADANSILIPADAPEVIQLPAGITHFRVIRDTADGVIALNAVA